MKKFIAMHLKIKEKNYKNEFKLLQNYYKNHLNFKIFYCCLMKNLNGNCQKNCYLIMSETSMIAFIVYNDKCVVFKN